MKLEAPYCDWIIEREIDFSLDDYVAGGLDSDTYLKDGNFGKVYGNIHPWTIVDYHRIHATLASKGPKEIETKIGILVIQILNLGAVYRDKKNGFFSLPPFISGEPLTFDDESKCLNEVRDVLGLNKIGTKTLLSHNSKVTRREGNHIHITITDLAGTIPGFVEANRKLIDTAILGPNKIEIIS